MEINTGSIITEASPVVSSGVVFIGNRNGYFYALNTDIGQLKWKFSAGGISLEQSRPIINNGVIYLASWYSTDNFNLPGSLYAINESDGTQIWKSLNQQGFTSGPAYADGKVFINSDDTNIYSVDAATGNEIWKKSILANGSIPSLAAGKVFTGDGTGGNGFSASDSSTGNEVWKMSLIGSFKTSKPLIVSGN